jgi:DNA-binding response OmpR family regulator
MAKEPEKGSTGDSGKPRALKAVLVVDDDRQLASALQSILRDENYLVDVAFDGEEALLKVKVLEYDVVVCDVMMPRLRGDDFYVQAKKLRPNLANRFLFITGFGADSNIREFLSARCLKHLIKPFPIQELMKCVKELLIAKA